MAKQPVVPDQPDDVEPEDEQTNVPGVQRNAVINTRDINAPAATEQQPVLSIDDKLTEEAINADNAKQRLAFAPDVVTPEVVKGEDGHAVRPDGAVHIRVTRIFKGGKANEGIIEPGTYVQHDPRLFGLAEYLCDNGYATWTLTT